MNSLNWRGLVALLLGLLLGIVVAVPSLAQSGRRAVEPVEVDRIVAVVNDEVITMQELRGRVGLVEAQLRRQGTALPPRQILERQMLDRMVVERAQLQFARENGLRIDDSQLDQAIARIATGNRMNLAQFRDALARDGVAYAGFREDVRQEMLISRVREREVENKIVVSDGEIENFLANEGKTGGAAAEQYEVAHILVRVPEGASPEQLQTQRAKALQALAKLKAGEDFAELAAAYSDAPDALKGGSLGVRSLERLPTLYADAVVALKPGEVSEVLRSTNGFHIVRLAAKHGGARLAQVQQTRARHILIRASELVSEAEAKHRLAGLRDRLEHGGDFAELARLYSQDGSAAKGGDLGWLYPGDTVPEFERVMDALKPQEISQPVQSPFGWHLIQVLERRVQDVSEERQKQVARQALREKKSDEAYQDWLRQLRDRSYVELRLEER